MNTKFLVALLIIAPFPALANADKKPELKSHLENREQVISEKLIAVSACYDNPGMGESHNFVVDLQKELTIKISTVKVTEEYKGFWSRWQVISEDPVPGKEVIVNRMYTHQARSGNTSMFGSEALGACHGMREGFVKRLEVEQKRAKKKERNEEQADKAEASDSDSAE